jgi:hypothetical protein
MRNEWKKSSEQRIDVLLMPSFEDHELPQSQRVIAHAADMFLNEPSDEHRFEIPALQRSR